MSIVDDYKVSYAQNREDLILEAFFPEIEKGTYIDIGANHPVRHSVTKRFYDKGWRGMNIEPNPDLFKLIEKHRPEDINLNIGIGSEPGELSFRIYHSLDGLAGLSTFSDVMKRAYEKNNSAQTKSYTDIKTKVLPLKNVLSQHKVGKIDFLRINVEGFEHEVLEGNDWTKFRPQMICIEATHLVRDWHDLLAKVGYKTVFNDGLNDYLIADEVAERAKKFDYAKAILLEKAVINSDVAEVLAELEQRSIFNEQEYLKTRSELSALEHDFRQAISQRNELFYTLQQYSTLRKQLRSLILQTHKRILIRLERLRQPGRAILAPALRVSNLEGKSTEELVEIAAKYDKQHLKHPSPYNSPRYLLYLILIGGYKLTTTILKMIIRVLRAIKGSVR